MTLYFQAMAKHKAMSSTERARKHRERIAAALHCERHTCLTNDNTEAAYVKMKDRPERERQQRPARLS